MMKLFFIPMACSTASRIALYEAGADAELVQVDYATKTLVSDGSDYRKHHPLGLVPFLEDGTFRINESSAILQYIAAKYPDAELAPTDLAGRIDLQRWLSFIGTELHRGLFKALLDRHAPPGAKEYALLKGTPRLAWLEEQLAGRSTLLDRFSIADAYLATILSWAAPVSLPLGRETKRYLEEMQRRPNIARALREEQALYVAQQARYSA